MKVIGQLESAQLEQIASTTTTPTPTGRVYADVTVPTAAVPRFYNGSTWLPLLTGQTAPLVSQNSGTACTVNWATGLNQQVILTGHALISFQNPQPGQVHMLAITQGVLEGNGVVTPYQYKLNMIDQDSRQNPYQPQGALRSSETAVYGWFYSAGIKAAYSSIPYQAGAPLSALSTAPVTIDHHPTLKMVAVSQTGSPYSAVYAYNDGVGFGSGVGSGLPGLQWGFKNFATPTAANAATLGLAYSPDGASIFMVSGTSTYLQGWLNDVNGISSSSTYAYSTSSWTTAPAGAGKCVSVHPSGLAVLIGHATTPFMSAYPIVQVGTGAGVFGSKYANPGSLPAAAVLGAAFSPTGDYVAINTATTPYLQVWSFDVANGWGTASSNPSSLPTSGGTAAVGKQIAWRPQGDFIAMAMSSSPYIAVYAFNRATGAIGSNVCTLSGSYIPAATINGLAWTPDGQYLIGACTSSPYLYVWNFGGNGNTLTNATAASFTNANPGMAINDVCVGPSGDFMFLAGASSPYLIAYPLPRVVRNYLRIFN